MCLRGRREEFLSQPPKQPGPFWPTMAGEPVVSGGLYEICVKNARLSNQERKEDVAVFPEGNVASRQEEEYVAISPHRRGGRWATNRVFPTTCAVDRMAARYVFSAPAIETGHYTELAQSMAAEEERGAIVTSRGVKLIDAVETLLLEWGRWFSCLSLPRQNGGAAGRGQIFSQTSHVWGSQPGLRHAGESASRPPSRPVLPGIGAGGAIVSCSVLRTWCLARPWSQASPSLSSPGQTVCLLADWQAVRPAEIACRPHQPPSPAGKLGKMGASLWGQEGSCRDIPYNRYKAYGR